MKILHKICVDFRKLITSARDVGVYFEAMGELNLNGHASFKTRVTANGAARKFRFNVL